MKGVGSDMPIQKLVFSFDRGAPLFCVLWYSLTKKCFPAPFVHGFLGNASSGYLCQMEVSNLYFASFVVMKHLVWDSQGYSLPQMLSSDPEIKDPPGKINKLINFKKSKIPKKRKTTLGWHWRMCVVIVAACGAFWARSSEGGRECKGFLAGWWNSCARKCITERDACSPTSFVAQRIGTQREIWFWIGRTCPTEDKATALEAELMYFHWWSVWSMSLWWKVWLFHKLSIPLAGTDKGNACRHSDGLEGFDGIRNVEIESEQIWLQGWDRVCTFAPLQLKNFVHLPRSSLVAVLQTKCIPQTLKRIHVSAESTLKMWETPD